jgi:hypothetical protein
MTIEQSVPKRRQINFRRRGITQKKTYSDLLTSSMVQSPCNRFSASPEIPRILWNPKLHYRSYKQQPREISRQTSVRNFYVCPENV